MKVNRTMETTCSVTARGRWFSDMGKGPRGSRIDRLLMIAALGAGGREKVKLFAGRALNQDLAGATSCVVTRAASAFSSLPKRASRAACFSGERRFQISIIFSAVPIRTLAWVSLKSSVMEGGSGFRRCGKRMLALSTRSGIAGVSVFAVSLATVSGFFRHRLLGTGLLRGCLLSFVQAWEGEIRNLVHVSRSSQSLVIDLVDPRFFKAWAGYSRRNDKKTFIWDFCDQWPQGA